MIALFALQASGVHMHAETGHHSGDVDHGLHLTHEFSAEHAAIDHDEHVDVAVTDTALSSTSADFVAIATHYWSIPAPALIETRWLVPQATAPPRRTLRTRPPLRAPPTLA